MNISITIYIDTLSPFSKALHDDLKKVGIHAEVKYVDKQMEAAVEMYKLTNTNRVPVIKITQAEETTTLIGYTKEHKKHLESLFRVKLPH